MAYPQPPKGWARSGWVANQLIPDQLGHSAALQYLGGIGTPASRPQVSGTPTVNGQTLSTAPNALGGTNTPSWQMPDWLNTLLFGTGVPEQTAVEKPKGPALTQVASVAPISATQTTPQSGHMLNAPKKRGFFNTILDLSPGSPTVFSKDSVIRSGIGI